MVLRKPIYHTYDRWRELGYQVMMGEKSHKKTQKGVALFCETQVKPRWVRRDGLARSELDFTNEADEWNELDLWALEIAMD